MGHFYINVSIRGVPPDTVVAALGPQTRVFAGPSENGWTCFADAALSDDPTETDTHVGGLAERFATDAVQVENHDDDLLAITAYSRGKLVANCLSCPDYFDPDGPEAGKGPELDGAAALAGLGTDVTPASIEDLLVAREQEFVYAVDLHAAVASLIGLPAYSVGFGFDYAGSGDLPIIPRPLYRTPRRRPA